MKIGNSLGAAQPDAILDIADNRQLENTPLSPASWGADSVSFSPEALAALRQSQEESATLWRGQADLEETKQEEADKAARDEYKKFMDKVRGNPVSGSVDEQIAALREKLKSLHDSLARVAADTSMPEGAKQGRIGALNGQINAIQTQINELLDQAAKEAA